MVLSSSVLVSSTNLSAQEDSSLLLFGGNNNLKASAHSKKIKEVVNKGDLVLVPLMKAPTSPRKNVNMEADEALSAPSGGLFALGNSPTPIRDPQEGDGLIVYTVKDGDSLSVIAQKHNITTNTILWANNIENMDSILPGDKLFILPVAGVSHSVQSEDTIEALAEKYKADKNKIISFNDLPANGKLEIGQQLIIPGGQKETPQRPEPTPTTNTVLTQREYATPSGGTPAVSGLKKLEGAAGTGHKFPYGYCTWYVAQKRHVPWGGNAGTWLYNAKNMGYSTGTTPKKGAILVTSESWWGHVAIVESVGKGTITISEMNYKGWGKTSTRTISTSNRVIKGYIY